MDRAEAKLPEREREAEWGGKSEVDPGGSRVSRYAIESKRKGDKVESFYLCRKWTISLIIYFSFLF